MLELLILAVVIFLLWRVSKPAGRAADWLASCGSALYDAVFVGKGSERPKEQLRQRNKRAAEDILSIKGEASNVIYTERVREEIDRMLRGLEVRPDAEQR